MRSKIIYILFRGLDRLVREGDLGKFEKRVENLRSTVVVDQVPPLIVWWTEVLAMSCDRSHL
jgi:hypothetical protein